MGKTNPREGSPLIIHVVRPGDTLWSIAKRYGVTVETIRSANRAVDPEALVCGMRLLFPHPEPLAVAEVVRHVVQPGDTLWLVSWRFGVPMATLTLANHLQPPYTLQVGQTLLVPMAVAF